MVVLNFCVCQTILIERMGIEHVVQWKERKECTKRGNGEEVGECPPPLLPKLRTHC